MKLFFSIAVHSSVKMKKDFYYFLYKGVEFKYSSSKYPHESDMLTCRCDVKMTTDKCYHLMTEFLSVISYERDAEIIPEPGSSTNLNCSLKDYHGGYLANRRIPVQELLDEFYFIPPIRNKEQETLVRLYREARSSNNKYHSILFYWHALVYPSKKENAAVKYIDDLCSKIPIELTFLKNSIDRIYNEKLFAPENGKLESLGRYIQGGVRNSIAHIVRNNAMARNLQLDHLSELRHLSDINNLLRHITRYRLKNEWGLNEPHDLDIFRYFEP